MLFEFDNTSSENRHNCKSHKEGNWAVFTCPLCPGYERRLNLLTGEVKTNPGDNPEILHSGTFVPVGLDSVQSLPN